MLLIFRTQQFDELDVHEWDDSDNKWSTFVSV